MEDFWMEHRYSSCCYQLEPHYEHTYQLVFLLKGKILYQVGEKQYEVSKGGMILPLQRPLQIPSLKRAQT